MHVGFVGPEHNIMCAYEDSGVIMHSHDLSDVLFKAPHDNYINYFSIVFFGKFVLCRPDESSFQIWNIDDIEIYYQKIFENRKIDDVQIWENRKYVLVILDDGVLEIYETSTGKLLSSKKTYEEFSDSVSGG